MHQIYGCSMFILLCILHIVIKGPTLCFGNTDENKSLRVGEELWRETLPLQGGSRLYQVQNLKPQTWYEVKISYPASIPASFSIQLERDNSDMVLNNNRRLLNTEKLIFKTESDLAKTHVLVTVDPEGFVAIPHVPERQFIMFNIVCDELLFGIPHQAWWVVVLAILCIGIAIIIPFFLPPCFLPKNQNFRSADHVSKTS
ncbi:putative transmembrane protein [Senna tora]|uniref:Putative transmembrane protein n=1 Tax=Senna tora TaxID=362788 RepID=A0A834T896_9FABA|nr:putative transmembrane protein [Senna tora]